MKSADEICAYIMHDIYYDIYIYIYRVRVMVMLGLGFAYIMHDIRVRVMHREHIFTARYVRIEASRTSIPERCGSPQCRNKETTSSLRYR